MPDFRVKSGDFQAVPMPGAACKLQVHEAPVYITFTAPGTDTRGMLLEPGAIIPISATDAARARSATGATALLVFEVFG